MAELEDALAGNPLMEAAAVAARVGCSRRGGAAIINEILGIQPRSPGSGGAVFRSQLEGWARGIVAAPPVRSRGSADGVPVVYFVKCARFVKIGFSERLELRLLELQRNNPHQLTLLAAYYGGRGVEAFFHGYFSPLHVRDEWFRCGPEIYRHVRGLAVA